MPRFSKTLYDAQGNPIGIACGRIPHKNCSTPECRNHAGKLCDYPVTRRGGGKGTCDRPICERCAVRVGPDKDYCPAHSRLKEKTNA
jgi:hypothetical protein